MTEVIWQKILMASVPGYNGLNDLEIEDAYYKHINYNSFGIMLSL